MNSIKTGDNVIATEDMTAQALFGEGGDKVIVKEGTKGHVARFWGTEKYPLMDVMFEGVPAMLVINGDSVVPVYDIDIKAAEDKLMEVKVEGEEANTDSDR